MGLKIALVIPGYQSSPQDWCIPVFTNLAHRLAAQAELHVFALRYPRRRDHYRVDNVFVHSLGAGGLGGQHVPVISLLKLWLDSLRAVRTEHGRAPFDVVM